MAESRTGYGVAGGGGRRRKVLIVLAVLVALGLGGVGVVMSRKASPTERAEHYREVAKMLLYIDRDYKQAEDYLVKALEIEPGHIDTQTLLAQVRDAQGQTAAAKDALEKILEIDPENAKAKTMLAKEAWAKGDKDTANELLTAAFENPPAPVDAYALRAQIHLIEGRPMEAIADLDEALKAQESNLGLVMTQAYITEFLGRVTWDRALTERTQQLIERAGRLAAQGGTSGLFEARLLIASGRYSAARQALTDVESTGGDDLSERAMLLSELQRVEGAAAEAEKGLRAALQKKRAPYLWAALVRLLARDPNRLQDAEQELREASQEFPNSPLLSHARVALLVATVERDHPEDLLVPGLRREGYSYNQAEPQLVRGLTGELASPVARRARLGITGPAALTMISAMPGSRNQMTKIVDADVASLLAQDQNDAVALIWKAAMTHIRGDSARAVQFLERAIRHDQMIPEARFVRSVVHGALGQWADAVSEAEAAIEHGGGTPARIAQLALALQRAGNLESAVARSRDGLRDWPGSVPLMHRLYFALSELPKDNDPDGKIERELTLLAAQLRKLRPNWSPELESDPTSVETPQTGESSLAQRVLQGAWEAEAARWGLLTTESDRTEPKIAQALALERAGRPQQAVEILRAVAAETEDFAPHSALAQVLWRSGSVEESERVLRRWLDKHGGRTDSQEPLLAKMLLAQLLKFVNKTDEALEEYRQLFDDSGNPLGVRLRSALELLMVPDTRDEDIAAVRQWTTAEAQPDSDDFKLIEGYLVLAEGDFEKSVRIAKALSEKIPESPEPPMLHARALLRSGVPSNTIRAEEPLERVLELNPGEFRARRGLSLIRLNRGLEAMREQSLEEARSRLSEAVLDVPLVDSMAAVFLGNTYNQETDASLAEEMFRVLNRKSSSSPAAPVFMGTVLGARSQYEPALVRFEEAVKRAPRDPIALIGYVSAALMADKPKTARRLAERRVASGDPSGVAQCLLGRCLDQAGDFDGALGAYLESLERDPGLLAATIRVVPLLAAKQRKDDAVKMVQRAVEAAETPAASDVVLLTRQLLLVGSGNAGQEWLLAALSPDRESAAAHWGMGRLLAAAGDFQGARERYEKSIAASPEARGPYLALVGVLVRQDKLDEAMAFLKSATQEQPSNPAPWTALGMLSEQAKDFESAEKYYRGALAAAPDYSLAGNNLAWVVGETLGRPEEGLEIIKQVKERFPYEPNVADTYGWLLYRVGRYTEALVELDLAVQAQGRDPAIQLHRAKTLDALRRDKDAIAAYLEVLRLSPEFAKQEKVNDLVQKVQARMPR